MLRLHATPTRRLWERVRGQLPGKDTLYDHAELFRIISETPPASDFCTSLFEAGDVRLCDIASLLGMTQSAISHQLAGAEKRRW